MWALRDAASSAHYWLPLDHSFTYGNGLQHDQDGGMATGEEQKLVIRYVLLQESTETAK